MASLGFGSSLGLPLMARTTFLCSVSLFVSTVLARTVEYNLKISNGKIAPDGVERDATLGMYPHSSVI